MVINKMVNKEHLKSGLSYLLSLLGALGCALQNYIAVELFIKGILTGVVPIGKLLSNFIKAMAVGAGGLCSGTVNFLINVKLLKKFFERMEGKPAYQSMSGWTKFRYFGGIVVFVVTGVLFGATAFTFGMASPLAVLAVASGVFVSIIMTIQEVATWLESFDNTQHKSLLEIFRDWKKSLTFGKICGHMIAAGNVIALSCLFTLGLADVLVALGVAAFPAFIVGAAIAFTIGAFTEFYFYNFFLADFCGNFKAKWNEMMSSPNAKFGLCCISVNAFVNGALTFSGVALLAGFCMSAGIALPPVAVFISLSAACAFFAGTASFVLGMDFWIGDKTASQVTILEKPTSTVIHAPVQLANDTSKPILSATKGLSIFSKHEDKHDKNISENNPLFNLASVH